MMKLWRDHAVMSIEAEFSACEASAREAPACFKVSWLTPTRAPTPAGYMRHPMYSGLLMSSFGLAAVTHNECRLALVALLWLVRQCCSQCMLLFERGFPS